MAAALLMARTLCRSRSYAVVLFPRRRSRSRRRNPADAPEYAVVFPHQHPKNLQAVAVLSPVPAVDTAAKENGQPNSPGQLSRAQPLRFNQARRSRCDH